MNGNKTPGIIFGIPIRKILYSAIAVLLLLIIVLAAAIVRNRTESGEYRNLRQNAQEYFDAGEYQEAAPLLRKAADLEKTDECLVMLSECYCRMGEFDKAIEILTEVSSENYDTLKLISEVEERRTAANAADMVEIAGEKFSRNATSLLLSSRGLTDADLSNISQLYSLSNVSLENNNIQNIGFLSSLGGLRTLNLSDNSIGDLSPLSSLTGLRTLYLDNNPIADFSPLYSLSGLTTLSVKGINITDHQLQSLMNALPDCSIHSEKAEEAASDITLGGRSFSSASESLDLSGCGISDISALSNCRHLKNLNLAYNAIYDLTPLMDIPTLETLNISYNNISDIRPLMGLTTLKNINADGNSIMSVAALGSLPNLSELHLSGNPITNFSTFRKLRQLSVLTLDGTGLTDGDLPYFYGYSSIFTLSILDNPALTGSAVEKLKSQITASAVMHDELNFQIVLGSRVFSSSDTEVDASRIGLQDISPIEELKELRVLNLEGNSIEEIYVFSNVTAPIYSLDLSDNLISDVSPLNLMTSLETVDISNNLVSDIKCLGGLTNLRYLYIGGNPIPEEDIMYLRDMLPNCIIYTN